MIHFNFTVTKEEGATIFECIEEELQRTHENKADTSDPAERAWYTRRARYLQQLIAKMNNTQLRAPWVD